MLYIIFIHIVMCILVFVLMKAKALKVQTQLMPVVVLVPLWGMLCVLLLHLLHVFDWEGTVEAGVEKLHTNEDAHRSLLVENLNNQRSVVALQEALILNDAQLRRGMMLDVLYENPEDYHALLNEAINNEDGEVVHYATTAMAELSKEYDAELRRLEKRYADDPENLETLRNYCDFLERYLQRNLLSGQMEQLQRRQYVILLERLYRKETSVKVCQRLLTAQIRLGDFAQATEQMEEMLMRWPQEESTLMCRLELAVGVGDGRALKQIVEQAHQEERYLSMSARQRLAFFATTMEERKVPGSDAKAL
ncbi:MAG: hypothetical protein E7322_02950 [Clostridiales bacterium]|nr:hypothetical protein [Clostridiales bacterium]